MPKRPAGHILAVALVTAVLCSDQLVTAAPTARVGEGNATLPSEGFVRRLQHCFRRSVPAITLIQNRSFDRPTATAAEPTPVVPHVVATPLSPFQFRLPPPAL